MALEEMTQTAMAAGLVAFAPDVDLQRPQFAPTKGQVMLGQLGFKTIHVPEDESVASPGLSKALAGKSSPQVSPVGFRGFRCGLNVVFGA
ncbi:MAG: hypothetical protein IPK15_24070 [Verrucomicrobia bacterium]|nr:hypothetical protein [Verrucomicrobiota bacterium]